MKTKFTFAKEEDNRWYAVLPEWDGAKADLEMVMGADIMLDELSHYGNRVTLLISDDSPENPLIAGTKYNLLTKIEENVWGDGATYLTDGSLIVPQIWLCSVLQWVFTYYPDKLYYAVTASY